MTRFLAAVAVMTALVGAPTSGFAQDDLTILVTAQARVDDVAQRLRDVPSLEAEIATAPLPTLSADLVAQYDVVIVWTHQALTDQESTRIGDLLADHVDGGGAVVELVFAQLEPNPDIQGRWRSRNNAAVSSSTRDGVFTAGSLGTVAVQGHPILEGVERFSADRNRPGTAASVLPGAQLVASYDDGQVLVATREDRPGRVAWLGFYPGDPTKLQGDWERMLANAAGWAGQPVTAHAGGPYAIDEGTPALELDASASGDNAVRFTWDLDADGVFDDAEGPIVAFDTTGLDGPGSYAVWVQVEDEEGRVGQANAAVVVANIAPVIESAAPQQARLGVEYTYSPRVVDPAGALDPLVLTLEESPPGAEASEGTIRWTASEADLGGEFPFALTVDDGDGGTDEQTWVVVVAVADADGDGVLDADDECDGELETENNYQDGDGCPDEIPQEVVNFTGVIKGITFETDKDVIRKSSEKILLQALQVLEDFPDVRLEVQGHTDDQGEDEYNMDLSQRRTESVVRWFAEHGIDEGRFDPHGYGESKPIADNTTSSGRAQNRRVEFQLIDQE